MSAGHRNRLLGRLRGEGLGAHLLRGAGGNIAVAGGARALSLLVSVILARALAPSGYGVYAFAISLMGLLQVPAQFGVDQLLSRELASNEATGRWDLARGLLRRAAQLVTLSTAVIAVVTLAVLWNAPLHVSREGRWTLTVAVALMVLNAYGMLGAATLMGLRRVVIAQIPMQVGRPALFLAGVVSLWWFAHGRLDPVTAMGANVVAAAVMLAVLFLVAGRSFRTRAEPVAPQFETRRWLGSALPFTFMAGLGVINAQTDIVMLGLMKTSHDVGIYRVAVAGAGLIPLVLMAVNNAIGPTLSRLHSQGDRTRLARVARLAAYAGLLGGLAVLALFAVWGHDLIRLVYGTVYLVAWAPLMILAVGQTTNAGMGPVGLVLNMTGYEKDAFFGLAVAAVVNITLNAALIPFWGTLGAATATAIATMVWNVLMAWRVKARLGFVPLGVGKPRL